MRRHIVCLRRSPAQPTTNCRATLISTKGNSSSSESSGHSIPTLSIETATGRSRSSLATSFTGRRLRTASAASISTINPPNVWTRRALQEKTMSLERTVLHQCIRPRLGAHAPDHHGNPRASDLISDHASEGYFGGQFSDSPGRPILHLFSFSRRPRWGKDYGAHIAFLAIIGMWANSRALHRRLRRSDLKIPTAMQNAPGDASEFVGERNRQFEPIESSGCSRDPRFKTMPLPALWAQ
jgi:hypothetical protein